MRTEARKKYRSGFCLSEGELRRLHETSTQQMRRTAVGESFKTHFEVKYRNGAVATPDSLEDILAEENFGSSAILRLRMSMLNRDEEPSTCIAVQFTNTDEDDSGPSSPISYLIIGDDRDWVFITSSQIDERITKVKSFSLNELFPRMRGITSSLVATLFSMATLLFLMFFGIYKQDQLTSARLRQIESAWYGGAIKDSGTLLIQITDALNSRSFIFRSFIWQPAVLIGIPIFILVS